MMVVPCDSSELSSSLSSSSSLSCSSKYHENAVELFEECWFFKNLLKINTNKPKNTFTRCYSDPCPSSKICQETPAINKNESSTKTATEGGGFRPIDLVMTPSLPPNVAREGHNRHRDVGMLKQKADQLPRAKMVLLKEEIRREKEFRSGRPKNKATIAWPRNNLLTRTQTLPPLRSQAHHDQQETKEKIMSKSSRQTSLNLADFLPPRHDKGTSKYRSQIRTTEIQEDIINTGGSKEMRRRYYKGRNLRRSLSELETEEVQGFKDLGFTFDNKEMLSPSVVNILPGLQEKKEQNLGLENKLRRPYLSEAWLVQYNGPPTPKWASSMSSKEMKAQIKFWARSVASNVRQEC